MSPDTITTIALAVLGVVGTLGGVWWGQWLEDKRRRRGEVRREISAWVGGMTTPTPEGDVGTRYFDVRFFNDREVKIALWDVQVEIYWRGSLIQTIVPRSTSGGAGMGWEPGAVEPIDLESRKSVYMSLELKAEGQELSLLKSAERLQFVATMMPDNEKVSKPLPAWDNLEES